MAARSRALVLLLCPFLAVSASGQSSGRFHLVRSTSGSRGAADGSRFLIEDPRVSFHAGQDRQVMVAFEWQGPPGQHKCTATWKDPSGRVVFTSDAMVNARGSRFGAYWALSLPDSVATGTWVVEALVDGEPAGAHAFQMVAGAVESVGEPLRRPLTTAELYQRGLAEILTIEAVGPAGTSLGISSGFFVAPDLVSTSFAGINAAHRVRAITADQKRLETTEVVAWDRRDDWAVLRFPAAAGRPAPQATTRLAVGDRCYFLEAQREGSRVIVETTIVGQSPTGDLTLALPAGEGSNGGPILNEYGEVAAVLAGDGILGAGILDTVGINDPHRMPARGGRARGLAAVPEGTAASKSLQELEQAGHFVRPVVTTSHFVSGVMGTRVEKGGPVPVATNQRSRFSRGDGKCVVFVTWSPGRKEDSTSRFELFDEEGRSRRATEARKVRLRPGESFVQYWDLDLAALPPGVYRVDVMLGPDPLWRTFFRVTN